MSVLQWSIMKTRKQLQTMALSYQEICEGKSPWVPLGMFMHDFFGNFPRQRKRLVKDPIQEPEPSTQELHRWASFCAASVEYLSQKYGVACPEWVHNPAYVLAEPWYNSSYADLEDVRRELEKETPKPFKRRNIYCEDRIYANKFEIAADLQRRKSA
jgi:hypothetical protein